MKKTSSIAILTIALSLNNLVMAGPGDRALVLGAKAALRRAAIAAPSRGMATVGKAAPNLAARAGMMRRAAAAAQSMAVWRKEGSAVDPATGMVADVVNLHGGDLAEFARVKGAPRAGVRRTAVSPVYNILLQLETAGDNEEAKDAALAALGRLIAMEADVTLGTTGLEQPPLLKATQIGSPDAVGSILRVLGQEAKINGLRFEVSRGKFLAPLQVAALPGSYNGTVAKMLLECGATTGVEELLLTAVRKDDQEVIPLAIEVLKGRPTTASPSKRAERLMGEIAEKEAVLAEQDKDLSSANEVLAGLTEETLKATQAKLVKGLEDKRAATKAALDQKNTQLEALKKEIETVELQDEAARSAKFVRALEQAHALIQSPEARRIVEQALTLDLDQMEIRRRAIAMMKAKNFVGARVMLASLDCKVAQKEKVNKGKEKIKKQEGAPVAEDERVGWGTWAWSYVPSMPSFRRAEAGAAAPLMEVVDEEGFTATERKTNS